MASISLQASLFVIYTTAERKTQHMRAWLVHQWMAASQALHNTSMQGQTRCKQQHIVPSPLDRAGQRLVPSCKVEKLQMIVEVIEILVWAGMLCKNAQSIHTKHTHKAYMNAAQFLAVEIQNVF
jgi:hypothetical protein